MTPPDRVCIGLFSTKYVLWEGSMENACVKLFLLSVSFLFIGTFLAFAEAPKEGGAGAVAAAEYAGSSSCKECHEEIYDVFMKSGHVYKLNKVVDGKPPQYPFTEVPSPPEGYTWGDVTYVIGGYNWKARFIGKDGYIITGKEGNNSFLGQYNFANPVVGNKAGWVKYHPGEKRPYNCGPCHTTGYSDSSDSHQDGLPGLIGTWSEPGIRCEACHGPGSLHVEEPRGIRMLVDRNPEQCGTCHRRDGVEAVNASGGFIKHHEQYEELFQSKHVILDCVLCHDPHKGVIQLRKTGQQTTRTRCENCHFQQKKYQASDVMTAVGVECIDCHMPRITKSAVGNAAKFTGDIRTHMMAIDPDQIGQFSEDGNTALSQLGLDFSCKSCHVAGGTASVLSDAELIRTAAYYHARK